MTVVAAPILENKYPPVYVNIPETNPVMLALVEFLLVKGKPENVNVPVKAPLLVNPTAITRVTILPVRV